MYDIKFAKERLEVRMSVSNLLARGEFPNGSASGSRERDAFGPVSGLRSDFDIFRRESSSTFLNLSFDLLILNFVAVYRF